MVLVDTGLGLDDYAHQTEVTQLFRVITDMPFDPQEAVAQQIRRPAGFPRATVHVHRHE